MKSVMILESAIVDGAQWHTVSCTKQASIWFRQQFAELEDIDWFQNIDQNWTINFNVFDMSEELYTILLLRWA